MKLNSERLAFYDLQKGDYENTCFFKCFSVRLRIEMGKENLYLIESCSFLQIVILQLSCKYRIILLVSSCNRTSIHQIFKLEEKNDTSKKLSKKKLFFQCVRPSSSTHILLFAIIRNTDKWKIYVIKQWLLILCWHQSISLNLILADSERLAFI